MKDRGYGLVTVKRRGCLVHRLAAQLWLGFDPASGLCVLHRCDNPRCFSPEHLFFGTQTDNMDDKVAKGRHRMVVRTVPNRRMTPALLDEAKRLRDSGLAFAEIGRRLGLTAATVSNALRGLTHAGGRPVQTVTAFGETKSLKDWLADPRCVACGKTLRDRLKHGWEPEVALTALPSPGACRAGVAGWRG